MGSLLDIKLSFPLPLSHFQLSSRGYCYRARETHPTFDNMHFLVSLDWMGLWLSSWCRFSFCLRGISWAEMLSFQLWKPLNTSLNYTDSGKKKFVLSRICSLINWTKKMGSIGAFFHVYDLYPLEFGRTLPAPVPSFCVHKFMYICLWLHGGTRRKSDFFFIKLHFFPLFPSLFLSKSRESGGSIQARCHVTHERNRSTPRKQNVSIQYNV